MASIKAAANVPKLHRSDTPHLYEILQGTENVPRDQQHIEPQSALLATVAAHWSPQDIIGLNSLLSHRNHGQYPRQPTTTKRLSGKTNWELGLVRAPPYHR